MNTRQAPWADPETLAHNRHHLREKLQRQLRDYERRYEIRSDRVRVELEAGRLRETAEVCDWLLKFQTWQALENGRAPRVE